MSIKVTKLRATIDWIPDPEAEHYEVPCKGCVGFCDLEDTDDATGEDFGENQCAGLTEIRRMTAWFVDLQFSWPNSRGGQSKMTMTGIGQSEEEAERDALAHFIQNRLANDSFDIPETGVRLRPCRSS